MALVGTGPTITTYGNDLAHIGREPRWYVFEVDGQSWDFSAEPDETGVLRSLPIGTTMIDATIACTKAAAATGTDVLSLQLALAGGDQLVFTGTADNGGALDVLDRSVIVAADLFPVAEVVDLEVKRSIDADTGAGITGGAHYRVAVLLARPLYDR